MTRGDGRIIEHTDEDVGTGDPTARKPMSIAALEPAIGTTIGRYVVVGPLGAGAMGAVYRAYDPKLQREVALKRLRARAEEQRGDARMIREARAMAQLNHPNVVAVYDVDAAPDGVTVAMECVSGRTLKDWLESPRGTNEILTMLVGAGRGLAAAHAAGLVHRDFKPANVLVTDSGTPKVTDFGLAKATPTGSHSRVFDDEDAFAISPDVDVTQHGAILGTPLYMAPEQAAGAPADARSDQYAFCVTAWQALFGAPPFRGRGDALRQAKLAGPPALPRGSPVSRRIVLALRRGLQPDPDARFASMEILLAELQTGAAARRAWLGAGVATTFLAALAIAWGSSRDPCEETARELDAAWNNTRAASVTAAFDATGIPYAARVAPRIVAQIDAYADAWIGQRRQLCAAPRDPDADLRMRCLERARDELDAVVGVLEHADADSAGRVHDVVAGLLPIEHCADLDALRASALEWGDVDPGAAVAALAQDTARAQALLVAGKYEDARRVAEAAWPIAVEHEAEAMQAELAVALGRSYAHLGQHEEAEKTYRAGLAVALRSRADRWVARLALDYAFLLANDRGRLAEAERMAEIGAAIAQRPTATAILRAQSESTLGIVDKNAGRFASAVEHHRRALAIRQEHLGHAHPHVAVSRTNLGLALHEQELYEEAIPEHRAALAIWLDAYGDSHPEVALVRNNLAISLEEAGHRDEAQEEQSQALASRIAAFGPRHPNVATSRNNLAIVLHGLGRDEEAEDHARQAIAIWQESVGERHLHVGYGHNTLGQTFMGRGRAAEAADAFERALAIVTTALSADHPMRLRIATNVAAANRAAGRLEVAESTMRDVLAARVRAHGADAAETAFARIELAHVLLDAGRLDEARSLAAEAWASLEQHELPAGRLAGAAVVVVRLFASTEPDRARTIADSVLDRDDPSADAMELEDLAELEGRSSQLR